MGKDGKHERILLLISSKSSRYRQNRKEKEGIGFYLSLPINDSVEGGCAKDKLILFTAQILFLQITYAATMKADATENPK